MTELEILRRLAVALAVGFVIGLERGWHERDAPEGSRVAGIRTFALTGLAGGLVAIIGVIFSPVLAAVITLALAGLLYAIRSADMRREDIGATTEVAAVVTFGLAILAGLDRPISAIGGAVVSSFLLGLKPLLHGWLRDMTQRELLAALQLLLLTAVVLPLLPDRGYGPYAALNPYRVWWMVVLVAGVSFAGYLAMKLLGPRLGVLLTGLAGGLASSTATTFQLARRGGALDPSIHVAVAASILAACTVMFVRVIVLAAIIHKPLLQDMAIPFGAAILIGTVSSVWCWLLGRGAAHPMPAVLPRNPVDLRAAIAFAAVLAVVIVLAEAGRLMFGAHGLYVVAAVAGLADVDAITLSVASQARTEVTVDVAVVAIAIASGVDTMVKAGLAAAFGSRAIARPVVTGLLAMVAGGALALAVQRGWLA